MAAIAREVAIFSQRRGAHLHPRLARLHGLVDGAHDAVDVGAAVVGRVAVSARGAWPSVGIADIVEVDAVDVILLRQFGTDGGQIGRHALVGGVEIARAIQFSEAQSLGAQTAAAERGPRSAGDRGEPGVDLHAPLVTLLDGEAQRVVARGASLLSREAAVPRLQGRGIGGGGTHARLEEHGVDIGLGVAVEDLRELALLALDALLRRGVALGPVEVGERRQPDGPYLALGQRLEVEGLAAILRMASETGEEGGKDRGRGLA